MFYLERGHVVNLHMVKIVTREKERESSKTEDPKER
jgi:hypothetical protein